MLYLFAIVNLILTLLCGLSLYNIYIQNTNGFLEKIILIVGVVLLMVSNAAIIWVNFGRGSKIKQLNKEIKTLEEQNEILKAVKNADA